MQNKITLCALLMIMLSGFILAANAATAESSSTATLKVTAADGKDVTLTINGNVAADQISELWYANNAALNNTDIAFNLANRNSTVQFMNMTVPKTDVLGGTAPIVTIDGVYVKDAGYSQDSTNFYVWFTILSNSGQIEKSNVQITFLLTPKLTNVGSSLSFLYTVGIVVVSALVVALSLLLIVYKRYYDKQGFQRQVKPV